MKTAIVVGAGISGLSSALRLQNIGYKVLILEKNNFIGGKLSSLESPYNSFNLTATSVIMSEPIFELFHDIHEDISSYIEFFEINPFLKVFFEDHLSLTFSKDLLELYNSLPLESFNEYLSFLKLEDKKYNILKNTFLKNYSFSLSTFLPLLKFNFLKTSSNYLSSNLHYDKLIKTILYQSMYIGSSPYKASNIFTLISSSNILEAPLSIKGGFLSLTKALFSIFLKNGGTIKTSHSAKEFIFSSNICKGVRTNFSNFYADLIVSTPDFYYTVNTLLPEKFRDNLNLKVNKNTFSCSTFILYLTVNSKLENLAFHNLILNKDFKLNIEAPFKGSIPKNPHLYVYKTTKSNLSFLNILFRVPNIYLLDKSFWTRENIHAINNSIVSTLESFLDISLKDKILFKKNLVPTDYIKYFNSSFGATYGLSHYSNHLLFLRPHFSYDNLKNILFIGDSIHPGSGVSSTLACSKLAIDSLKSK